ncbi:zinc finger protein 664-like isoform X2 [Cheilinus undulatus]|uniref:zinc finger protein 664-like isoform X2 n=1 Tax=Cheilinus undulatus TaxID=241271 RepID=UPI001BD49159|nr:zinc finger protein 664-like isoform X2 [Cheilinus undulatus]
MLHRTDIPQQYICKEEEALPDQLLFNQERNFKEDPEFPQIKEEQEEHFIHDEGEELELKQETESFNIIVISSESEQKPDFLAHNSHVIENEDPECSNHGDSLSKRVSELANRLSKNENVCNPVTGKESLKCDSCGETFKDDSELEFHPCGHTGQTIHTCKSCGKIFKYLYLLKLHTRIHTDEKPYSCETCGKGFKFGHLLKRHMKTHTDIPQQHICKEEGVFFDQQPCNEERNFRLDLEDPELPLIKEEQEGVYFSQEREQLELKKEPENFESAFTCEENDHSESVLKVVHQLLTHNSHVTENHEHGSSNHSDSTPETFLHESSSHSLELSNSLCKPDTGKNSFKCDTCGEVFVESVVSQSEDSSCRHMTTCPWTTFPAVSVV